jgi:hypothetical protein
MLALTTLIACKAHVPPRSCGEVMLGACVEATVALAPCERGRARNLDDSACMTTRDTRELARSAGVYVDENDAIACEAKEDELVASGRLGRVGCLARQGPPPPSCGARAVWGGTACVPLDRGGAVDIASWSRAAAVEVCARLARSPLAVSVAFSAEATLEVEVTVSAPNNDLTLSFMQVKTKPAVPEADLARALLPVDDALRRLGGSATASDVTAAATCRTSVRRPISVP